MSYAEMTAGPSPGHPPAWPQQQATRGQAVFAGRKPAGGGGGGSAYPNTPVPASTGQGGHEVEVSVVASRSYLLRDPAAEARGNLYPINCEREREENVLAYWGHFQNLLHIHHSGSTGSALHSTEAPSPPGPRSRAPSTGLRFPIPGLQELVLLPLSSGGVAGYPQPGRSGAGPSPLNVL